MQPLGPSATKFSNLGITIAEHVRLARLEASTRPTSALRGLRDRANLAVLVCCSLRRSEVAALTFAHVQQGDGCCACSRLPPAWPRVTFPPLWTAPPASPGAYRAKRSSSRCSSSTRPKSVFPGIAPHDRGHICAKLCRAAGGDLEPIQLPFGARIRPTTERYLGTRYDLVHAPNDGIKLRVAI